MAKKQPGTMLYFDIRPCLKRLNTEEKGLLFDAILDYAEHGVVPEFDGSVGVAWDFIRPRIDRDRERYETVSAKRTAAINARWERVTNSDTNVYTCIQTNTNEYKPIQTDTNEYKPIQTIPTTTTPTTTPTTPTTPTTATAAAGVCLRPEPPLSDDQKFENMKRQQMQRLMNWQT